MLESKKFVVVVLFIGIAAIIGSLVYAMIVHKSVINQNVVDENKEQIQIVKKEVDKAKSPEKFPSNIPIESGAVITQNYNATAPDGRFQATRVFQTTKSLAENLTIYKKYLEDNDWKVASTVNLDNYKMIFGTKGNSQLQVSIDQNSESKDKTVNISYTELP